MSEGSVVTRPGRDRVLLLAASALAGCAAALVLSGRVGWPPFLAWAAALVVVFRRGVRELPIRLDRRDWLALAALTAIAVGLRVLFLDEVPPGPWIDELSTAVNALHLLDGPFRPFGSTPLLPDGPDWVHTSNLYLLACAALLKLVGPSLAGVRLLSLVPGVAAVPLLYLAARSCLDRSAAFLAAGLLAASRWQVLVSRWGWDEVAVTTLTVVAFGLLLRSDDGRRPGAALLAGAAAGMALYGYASARLAVAAVLATVVLRAVALRDRGARVQALWTTIGVWVAAAPLLAYWLTHPGVFTARLEDVSIAGRIADGDWHALLSNVTAYAGMFHFVADPNPRQALPGAPALDPIAGVLFLAGVIAALATWRRLSSLAALLWLGVGLLGGVLSEGSSAPNTYRVGLVAPACFLLAGIGWGFLRDRLPARRWRLLAAVAALAVAGSTSFAVFDLVSRRSCHPCWQAFAEGGAAQAIHQRVRPLLEQGITVHLDRSLAWPTARLLLSGLLPRALPGAPVDWVDAPTLDPAALQRAVLVVAPARLAGLRPDLRQLPTSPILNRFGEPVAVVVSGDAALTDRQAVTARR